MTPRNLSLALLILFACLSAKAEEKPSGFEEEVYKTIGDIELKTRIYKPEGWSAEDKRPAIVFFFGGGWRNGTPQQFHEHSLHLAKLGFVAFAPEYRIKSKHESTPVDSTKDAKSAMRWVRANAGRLGVDPDRIAASGGSAGGHLAVATATIGAEVNEEGESTAVSALPNAIVAFNPAVNLMLKKIKEMFGEEVYNQLASISPHQHITADLPPTIIFHGTADTAVPYETVETFAEMANELGVKPYVRLEAYEGRPHGFFNFGRGDGKDYEDTVAKMDGFFRELGWLD